MWKLFSKKQAQEKKEASPKADVPIAAPKKKQPASIPASANAAQALVKTAQAKKKQEAAKGKKSITHHTDRINHILVRPLVSEKGAHASTYGYYSFVVASSANKTEIRKAFCDIYHVAPIGIRIIIMPAKQKRFGNRFGMRSPWKKALVRVPKGVKIDVYEGV